LTETKAMTGSSALFFLAAAPAFLVLGVIGLWVRHPGLEAPKRV
jgi:hypothetical protein